MMELLAAVPAMYTAWNSKFTVSLAGKLEAGIEHEASARNSANKS